MTRIESKIYLEAPFTDCILPVGDAPTIYRQLFCFIVLLLLNLGDLFIVMNVFNNACVISLTGVIPR